MTARLISRDDANPIDYTLKYVIVGEPYVGKSSMIDVVSNDRGITNREPTVGIEFYILKGLGDAVTASLAMNDVGPDPMTFPTYYKLQIWDCAGQIRFRSIVKSYFRHANVIIAVFDVTNRESFKLTKSWIDEVKIQLGDMDNVVMGLVANKIDLPRAVTTEEGKEQCEKLGCDFYYEVSAKTGHNLEECMNRSLRLVHEMVLSGKLVLKHRNQRLTEGRTLADSQPPTDVKCSNCF